MRKQLIVFLSVALVVLVAGCEKLLPQAPESADVLNEPLENLTQAQLAIHLAGDAGFATVFATADGLGPVFVQASCESCHVADGKGNPFNNLTRFGRYREGESVGGEGDTLDAWDSMLELGGPQLQHRSISNYDPETIPADAAHADFMAPNVTGLGYLDAVTDQTILDIAAKQAADGLVHGMPNLIKPPAFFEPGSQHIAQPKGRYIGRYGRKAAAIDLTMQTVGAYKQDMGITSDYDPVDPINHAVAGLGGDNVPDPEIGANTVDAVVFYLKTLKAPARRNAGDPDVQAGENVFVAAGCATCHQPKLTTGPSEIAALNKVEFFPYTDMLTHDMGPDLDDSYTEGIIGTSWWRTTPLWGLGLQANSQGGEQFLLHDGRASNYKEAIDYHKGEANFSRLRFEALSDTEKEQLYQFLDSL